MSKHTPGPWEVVSLSGYGGPFSIRMEYHSDNPRASKTHYGVQSVRTREDARLIAAAPDMLSALKLALDVMESVDGENNCSRGIEAVEDAIAKAVGRS